MQAFASPRQGAYGKIKTHSESLVSQLLRVGEVTAALRVKFFSPFKSQKFGESAAGTTR